MASFSVATPSRGLVHSRTIAAVTACAAEAQAAGHEARGWHLTHDLPIPDCHERVAELALATGADAVWFVEEDNIPPAGALVQSLELLEAGAPIVAVDYPVGDAPTQSCMPRDPVDGSIPWCGLGCTLVARRVFDALERPWFRTDRRFEITRFGTGGRRDVVERAEPYEYGGQDISFFHRAARAGLRITAVPDMTAGHALLRSWGRRVDNDGRHEIEVRDVIERAAW